MSSLEKKLFLLLSIQLSKIIFGQEQWLGHSYVKILVKQKTLANACFIKFHLFFIKRLNTDFEGRQILFRLLLKQ